MTASNRLGYVTGNDTSSIWLPEHVRRAIVESLGRTKGHVLGEGGRVSRELRIAYPNLPMTDLELSAAVDHQVAIVPLKILLATVSAMPTSQIAA